MIRKLSIKNFYSFKEDNQVSFLVNDKAPESGFYTRSLDSKRINRVTTIIGNNASGKTTFLKSISFIKWFLINSALTNKPDEDIAITNFLFDGKHTKASKISIEFEDKKDIYRYEVELNSKMVLFEKLEKKEIKKFGTLFKREWNKQTHKYDFNGKKFNLSDNFKKALRKNASTVSSALLLNHELSKELEKYWDNVITNVVETGRIKSNEIKDTAKFLKSNNKILKKAENLLKKYDIGLSGVDIAEEVIDLKNGKKEKIYIPLGIHQVKNHSKTKYIGLPFNYESGGTQSLLQLVRILLQILDKGGIAVLDEFDAKLHPAMLPELIELFLSEKENKKNAQLLFSTHHHEILNCLNKTQILITEKNSEGASEVWRLDDVTGVRNDDNFYAKYLSGAYGGIPNIL